MDMEPTVTEVQTVVSGKRTRGSGPDTDRKYVRRAGFLVFLRSIPVIAWIAAFTILPNLILVLYSAWSESAITGLDTDPTLENYSYIFTSEQILVLLGRTVWIAASSAFIAMVLGFLMAYIVVRHFPRLKWPLTILVIIPLWISFLMRVFSWKVILGEHGVLNGFLMSLGLIDEPASFLLYSPLSVFIALVYMGLPYAYLAAFVTLNRIPTRLYEAAGDLGANEFTTFRQVVWPIGKSAAGLGFTLVFIIAYGDYVTPSLVGGFDGTMVGTVVLQAFGPMNNWPLGAALAVTTLMSGLLVVALATLLTRSSVILED